MKEISDSYKKIGQLHHAYCLLGERDKVKAELLNFLKKDLKFETKGNPDFWLGEYNVFKIDDGRKMQTAHLNRPVKYDRKVFVICANFMTKDAQNSLLKIFEEPSAETVFFLILPETIDLLPTLKSRMITVEDTTAPNPSLTKEGERTDAVKFLKLKIGKRLEITAKIAKDIKDEKLTKNDAITFLKNLEQALKSDKKNLKAIEDIEKAISYANDESPSIKVILDHLAVTL